MSCNSLKVSQVLWWFMYSLAIQSLQSLPENSLQNECKSVVKIFCLHKVHKCETMYTAPLPIHELFPKKGLQN